MINTTKIFFERTTKNNVSLQALGNVYRNSKWTDLHVFNIKKNSLLQFKNVFILFLLLMTFYFFMWRLDFSILNMTFYKVNEILGFSRDIILSWFWLFFYSLSIFFLKITKIFIKMFYSEILTNTDATKNSYIKNVKNYDIKTNLKNSSAINYDFLLVSLHLQKLTKLLHLTNLNFNNFILHKEKFLDYSKLTSSNSFCIKYLLFINNNKKFNLSTYKYNNFRDKNSLFYNFINVNNLFSTHFFKVNPNLINSLSYKYQNIFTKNIKQNLILGKESKWLLKNSLLSYEIITKSNTTTHVKKLYGNISLNANIANKNIWASNKLSIGNNTNSLNLDTNILKTLKTNLIKSQSLSTLNHLEESTFFLIKRFKFLNSNQSNYQFEPFIKSNEFVLNNIVTKKYNLNSDLNALKNTLNKNDYMFYLYDNHIYFSNYKDKNLINFSQQKTSNLNLIIEPMSIISSSDLNLATYFFKNVIVSKNSLLVFSNMS